MQKVWKNNKVSQTNNNVWHIYVFLALIMCPVGVTCHIAESLIDASCFQAQLFVPKCHELICGFTTWKHGPKAQSWTPTGDTGWFAQQMWGGLGKVVKDYPFQEIKHIA